jgi:hypothetical protein
MLGEEQKVINKHLLSKVSKIYHIGKIEADKVEMFDVKVALGNITNKVCAIYNTNEG